MKLVPDETGSREQRQRKGCFRQGKERTDLSLDTLPVALKKNISFSFFSFLLIVAISLFSLDVPSSVSKYFFFVLLHCITLVFGQLIVYL